MPITLSGDVRSVWGSLSRWREKFAVQKREGRFVLLAAEGAYRCVGVLQLKQELAAGLHHTIPRHSSHRSEP